MFRAKLFDFQTKHEESLLAKCADHEELVLSAPTGAGKTVLVSKFIDDYLDENPNTVFFVVVSRRGRIGKAVARQLQRSDIRHPGRRCVRFYQ